MAVGDWQRLCGAPCAHDTLGSESFVLVAASDPDSFKIESRVEASDSASGVGTRSAVARHGAAQHEVRSITSRFVLTRILKY
jgi:hypothetical protein